MPREYIIQFFLPRKPPNVTIEEFEDILNAEYKERQAKQLAKLIADRNKKIRRENEEKKKKEEDERRRQQEENDRKRKLKEDQ